MTSGFVHNQNSNTAIEAEAPEHVFFQVHCACPACSVILEVPERDSILWPTPIRHLTDANHWITNRSASLAH